MVLDILEGQGRSQDEGLSIFWQKAAGVGEKAGDQHTQSGGEGQESVSCGNPRYGVDEQQGE